MHIEICYLYGWFTGEFNSCNFKNLAVNNLELPLDSLLNHYTKSIQIDVAGNVLQKDTIVTYEYNDDFEKIEVQSFQEKEVPGINIQFNGTADSIYQLLKRKLIINDHKINNKFFPLYSLNTQKVNEETLVFSNVVFAKDEVKQKTESFFYLNINVIQLANEIKLLSILKYVKSFKNISISAKHSNNKILVNGSVEMNSDNQNALLQIIFNQ
jgi:hypothetical protein